MRPTLQEVFGQGTVWQDNTALGGTAGIFIPASSVYPDPLPPGQLEPDAQVVYLKMMLTAALTLNEANRNNNTDGIRTTITYGEYDNIIDPPGSTNVFRRDVFSVIAYQPQAYTQFNPNDILSGGGGGGGS